MSRHAAARTARAPGRRTGLVVVALSVASGLVLSGALVWRSTDAAFNHSTTNAANSWQTGNVLLDDDAVGVAFDVADLRRGATGSRCITVTYTGTVVPAAVRLYAADHVDGGLADDLHLVVEEGTGGSFADCSGFSPVGGPAAFSGSVAAFAGATAHGAGHGSWAPTVTGEDRSYRITYTVGADAPQSSTVGLSFVWEAQA